MRSDKAKAIKLRRGGKSYNEIRDALKIPKSTLSDWFRDIDWSTQIRKELSSKVTAESKVRLAELDRIRGQHLARVYSEAVEEALEELKNLKYSPLFLASLMLYWGEGDKATKTHVRLSNTDPKMLRLFYTFLKEVCGVPESKIAGHILVYPDLDEPRTREYWSSNIGLPQSRFTKSTVIQGRHPTKRLGYGVCTVLVTSTYLKKKILVWLEVLSDELIRDEYYENIGVKRP